MKYISIFCAAVICISFFSFCAPRSHNSSKIIELRYRLNDTKKHDIYVSIDTLHNGYDTIHYKHDSVVYSDGYMEQALAYCYDSNNKQVATQDVFSSMYLDHKTRQYDCITNTTFHFADGDIISSGIFHLIPGNDSLPPDHDFPIVGGTGIYSNIYGTYTRKYFDTIFHVQLKYYSK